MQQYDDAIDDFTVAIQLNPQYEDAYRNRGTAKLYKIGFISDGLGNLSYQDIYQRRYEIKQMRRFGLAYDGIGDFSMAIKLNPTDYEAYHDRGCAYNALGYFHRALHDTQKAVELNPNPYSYNNRGVAYYNLQKYQKAIGDYTIAIQMGTDNLQPYYNRGTARNKFKQWSNAIADFNAAIAIDSSYACLYEARGYAEEMTGNAPAAVRDFRQAMKMDPVNMDYYVDEFDRVQRLAKKEKK